MKLSDFDYNLPLDLIAQSARPRSRSKLIVPKSNMDVFQFSEIVNFFDENDVIVINTSKVMKARFWGKCRRSERLHEVIFVEKIDCKKWNVLIHNVKKLKINDEIMLEENISFFIKEKKGYLNEVVFADGDIESVMTLKGSVPLPPYLSRPDGATEHDEKRYQTCYAKEMGSTAAPTAGLHFNKKLLRELEKKGVQIIPVVLHVGPGTFLPVKNEDISTHKMHSEWIELSKETSIKLNRALDDSKKITAIGTTSLRVLESAFNKGRFMPFSGKTEIFIHPPKRIKSTHRLVTNFHQPKSTLFMLVCSFCGIKYIKTIYKTAIQKKMSFLSLGDAMLLENQFLSL